MRLHIKVAIATKVYEKFPNRRVVPSIYLVGRYRNIFGVYNIVYGRHAGIFSLL